MALAYDLYDLYDLSRLGVHTLFPYQADGPAHILFSPFYCDVHKRGFLLYLIEPELKQW